MDIMDYSLFGRRDLFTGGRDPGSRLISTRHLRGYIPDSRWQRQSGLFAPNKGGPIGVHVKGIDSVSALSVRPAC